MVIEADSESAASHLTERAYPELGGEGAQGEFLMEGLRLIAQEVMPHFN